MASIEYGIDGYGRKIYAQEAKRGRTYTCPYCLDEIHVFKCYGKEDYFAHMPIVNRTPQQMICQGYTGQGSYKRSEGTIDKVYITNGGIPLFLCQFADGKYQLKAYFPPLSKLSMDLLTNWGAKVVISEVRGKEEYSVNNLRFYDVKTSVKWITIKCTNVKYPIPEVQQKWEWGIQGLDCDKDIFHSHYDGGCRVAIHSNIVVGKEYLIVKSNNNITPVKGISFAKKGILRFNHEYNSREYSVYAMTVNNVTDESIAFIQNKGFQLIEQNDDLIPMWPPAVIEGKELIYRRNIDKAFLFHKKRSDQRIFNIGDDGLSSIIENDNVFETNTNNKTLLLSDYQFNSLSSEIRYMLTQTRSNYDNEHMFKPCLLWKSDECTLKPLVVEDTEIFKAHKLFFESDSNINIYVLNKNHVEVSSKRIIEKVKINRKLVIDIEPFGKVWFEPIKIIKKGNADRQINVDEIIEALYHCNTTSIPFLNEYIEVFDFAKDNSKELYRIMSRWRQKQKIPYSAVKYLHLIKEALQDE